MRKLEDIPKKSPFKVPDGYFDQLPGIIQARIAGESRHAPASRIVRLSLKFALPVVAFVVAGIFWFRPAPSIESQLQEIDTDQIALYLDNTDHLESDEATETTGFTKQELDQLEEVIYSNIEYSSEDIFDDGDL